MAAQPEIKTLSALAGREDFLATSDPALQEGADEGKVKLLSYEELYELWERQQWATQDLDFAQDRIDWHERIPAEERAQRIYGLSAFFLGEQRVTDELGPIMRAMPSEDQRIFISTQIADEARHVRFFDRFFSEAQILEGEDGSELRRRLAAAERTVNASFVELFDQMLRSRVDALAADPSDTALCVECVTLYHMVIEGVLALTGQHFIIDYNERVGTLPGFCEGFRNVARDEHRHVAFGARFLSEMAAKDPAYVRAIRDTLAESLPVADKVLDPPWAEDAETWDAFGADREETHAFAFQALSRRLKVIGLA